MKKINPVELFLWTFRRNEKDVVNLYDSLSDIMKLATGGDILNFGYWDKKTNTPISAQKNMCTIFGKYANLDSNQKIIDVGSGFASPAIHWYEEYYPIEITCVNVNFNQLQESKNIKLNENNKKNINFLHSTATILPFKIASVDRVLALESAHHFKPLKSFIAESYKILKKGGIIALAIPTIAEKMKSSIMKLGVLSMTWSSEHYKMDYVESLLKEKGFQIIEKQKIGSQVYEPLTDYYLQNRESIKSKILQKYHSYTETILFKSICKMKEVSKNHTIDYVIIIGKKPTK